MLKLTGAVVPILFSFVAFILNFLCLFAGNKPGFMEDYHLVTLNASLLGQDIVNDLLTIDSDNENPISNLLNQLSDPIEDALSDGLSSATEALGLQDFYSAHLLNYCDGTYVPGPAANETVAQKDITKNVANCSDPAAMFYWNPRAALQEQLDKAPVNVTLEDLKWPTEIDDAVRTIKTAYAAIFVLYCLTIVLTFLSVLSSLLGLFKQSRLIALLNIAVAGLAFIAILAASAIVTGLINIAADAINEHGKAISVEAQKGRKFLALSWGAMACVGVSLVCWGVLFLVARRREGGPAKFG